MDSPLATENNDACLEGVRLVATPEISRRNLALRTILSGILLTLTFPHPDLGFLAWVALVPFLTTFPHFRKRQAIAYGYLLGLVFYGGVAYWMGVFAANKIGGALGIVAWLLATAIHAPLMSLFALTANAAWRQPPIVRLLAVPAAWALVEWVGELGTFGMGWGDLGYTQWHYTPILQITSLGGVFILGYLIVLANVAVSLRDRASTALAACLFLVALGWGKYASRLDPTVPKIRVAAIQCNINQDVDWSSTGRPSSSAYFYGTLSTFDDLIAQASKRGATYVALPETGIPGYLQFDPELRDRVEKWATANKVAVLAGGRYFDVKTRKDQNVVFMISPKGEIVGHYAKTKLVPFGEYIPYRSVFSFLSNLRVSINDIQAGTETQPPLPTQLTGPLAGLIQTTGAKSDIDSTNVIEISVNGQLVGAAKWISANNELVVGPMVCFESTYSRFARRQALHGATLLTVVTDDTWFGRTAAAKQHLAMSAIRAAETHRSLVRAAATGISAVFDSRGRLVSQLDWYKKGIVLTDVPEETAMTPYTQYGDWFVWLCAALLGIAVVSSSFKGRVRG